MTNIRSTVIPIAISTLVRVAVVAWDPFAERDGVVAGEEVSAGR